jgi:hypothetical protein
LEVQVSPSSPHVGEEVVSMLAERGWGIGEVVLRLFGRAVERLERVARVRRGEESEFGGHPGVMVVV